MYGLLVLSLLVGFVCALPQSLYGNAGMNARHEMDAHPPQSPGSNGTNRLVVVGGGAGLVFTPNQIFADIGDTITFQFQAKNHSVTQSSFGKPCSFLTDQGLNGFNSGFMPVAADSTSFPEWTIKLTTDKPVWGYCMQNGHCQQGMAFGINPPPSGNTFEAFQNAAKATVASDNTNIISAGALGTTSV